MFFFFFKQKTAYEMRISDWSSDVALPIFAGGAGHTGIHVGIFVGFTRNRRLQIGAGVADRHIGSRIATTRLQELQMAMRVARFALGSRTEYSGNVVVTFNVRLLREKIGRAHV